MPRDKEDKELQEESSFNQVSDKADIDKELEIRSVLQRVADYVLNCKHHENNDNEKTFTISLNKETKISVTVNELDKKHNVVVQKNRIVSMLPKIHHKVNLSTLKELVLKMIQEGPISLRNDIHDWSAPAKKIGRENDRDIYEKNPLKVTIHDVNFQEGSMLALANRGVPSL
jgi:hypothetical protein